MFRITKGLNLPISGSADPQIVVAPPVSRVAIVGSDYIGVKPTMLVQQGDRVSLGQPVFSDKKSEGVLFTAPAAGRVVEINRGERRFFQSLVIELEGDDAVSFSPLVQKDFLSGTREQVTQLLAASGLWTSFRTRPYSKIPAVGTVPRSIFVQAMDTNPLAVDPLPLIAAREAEFRFGLQAIAKLTDGKVFVCHAPGSSLPDVGGSVQKEEFSGPHPAGLAGTHIHFLDPVGPGKVVWSVSAQDVIAIGHLLSTGRLDPTRVITIAGPSIAKPQTVRTRLGASIDQLVEGMLVPGSHRVISGSVLSGRRIEAPLSYLGRYHHQISAIPEGSPREFLGWLSPGGSRFSVKPVFASALDREKQFSFSTTTGGSKRAMVPIGMYEKVVPLDIIPTFLLRSLITKDTEQAQALGCLELDEEDLSLCTFVCPGKTEYGPLLRESLTRIEKEG
jgi:Na+-transporting NADH:ubiquinone oxidoreductase subunit A